RGAGTVGHLAECPITRQRTQQRCFPGVGVTDDGYVQYTFTHEALPPGPVLPARQVPADPRCRATHGEHRPAPDAPSTDRSASGLRPHAAIPAPAGRCGPV